MEQLNLKRKPMEHLSPARPQPRTPRSRRDGVALLIVLGMLVILSIIVVAFMSSVTTDIADSKGYEAQTNARLLADSALNLVIAQIRQASTLSNTAWASQPGLIRTFDTSGSTAAYKLYSSGQMIVSGSFDPSKGTDLPPVSWMDQPNLYVDLNSPIKSGTNKPIFPIIDGNDLKSITVDSSPALSYSSDGTSADVQGFAVDPAASVGINYTPGTIPTGTNNPVPMPVQWLYMLKDGTLLPPVAASGKDATITSGTLKPTTANPIIARVAFWTDDETAKVNINTASEGTFWDTPLCDSQPYPAYSPPTTSVDTNRVYEWDLGMYQGAQKEYQRYPGHPATTCLSPVLGAWIRTALFGSNLSVLTTAQRAQFVNAITKIAPRVVDDATNSSMGGTQRAAGILTPDTDRLYATPDELLYMPTYSSQRDVQAANGTSTLAVSGTDQRALVEKVKFFLTANSKAPEQNLFNKPRIAIWPITKATINSATDTSKMTVLDQSIAFCSTISGTNSTNSSPLRYYFTRQDPTSPTTDWGTRNQAIYQYLQNLTSSPSATNAAGPIPGFGGTFGTKYAADNDQILTEIFDYIRCTNLVDSTVPYTNISGARGQVVPITLPNGTRGAGRIATLAELALVMVKLDSRWDETLAEDALITQIPGTSGSANQLQSPRLNYLGPPASVVLATGSTATYPSAQLPYPPLPYDASANTLVQCALVPNLYSPMAGFSALANDIRFKFTNSSITVGGGGVFTGTQSDIYETGALSGTSDNSVKVGGHIGPEALLESAPVAGLSTKRQYSYAPVGFVLVPGVSILGITSGSNQKTNTMAISGSVQVSVYAPNTATTPTQVFNLNFPTQSIPIPKLALSQSGTGPYTYAWQGRYPLSTESKDVASATILPAGTAALSGSSVTFTNGGKPVSRLNGNADNMVWRNTWFTPSPLDPLLGNYSQRDSDSVRSLVATGTGVNGDLRLVAMTGTVSSSWFQGITQAGTAYTDSKVGSSHSLRHSYLSTFINIGPTFSGATFGTLIQGPGNGPNQFGVSYYGNGANYGTNYAANSPNDMAPYMPGGVNGVFTAGGVNCGDWDNGPAFVGDGPLLNKADEGTDLSKNSQAPYIGDNSAGEGVVQQQATFFSPNRQVSSPVMFGSLPTGVARSQAGTVLPWQTLLFRPARSYLPGGTAHAGAVSPPDHLLLDLFWMPVVEPYPISEPFATAGKINLNYQIAPFTYITRKTGMYAVLQSVKMAALNPWQADYRPVDSGGGPGTYKFTDLYKAMGTYTTTNGASGGGLNVSVRRNIDIDDTLRQMDYRFSQNQPFISASEICTIPLIPADQTDPTGHSPYLNAGITNSDTTGPSGSIETKLATFWNANTKGDHFLNGAGMPGNYLTGDNSLERPYSLIYPRLTTKSNTYTVHVRVQSLKKVPSSDPTTFKNGQDQVTGEFRGSFVVERYLDPNTANFYTNGNLTQPTTENDPAGQLGPYRFRVVTSKQFAQ